MLVVPFAPTPVAEKYVSKDQLSEEQETFPLDMYMCQDCGHVQLLAVIDPEFLFDGYTYESGKTLGGHFKEYAERVMLKYPAPEDSLVVDIGSNDGGFLRCFQELGLKVLGVDPAREIAERATQSGIETLAEFLTMDVAEGIRRDFGAAHVVAANNVFAHADDLSGMAECIRELLAPGGVFVFEASYLLDVVDHMLLGTIFHEHLSYHSVRPLQAFLRRHGMELIDVERVSIQGGSIIGCAQLCDGPHPVSGSVAEILVLEEERALQEVDTLIQFASRLQDYKTQLKGLLRGFIEQGATIVGFGAARSGTTLMAQMELGGLISFIVDDNEEKQNRFSPGDHIPVLPTQALYEKKPEFAFILAWVHAKRIIENNRAYLEQGGKFIVCFPEIKVIAAGTESQI